MTDHSLLELNLRVRPLLVALGLMAFAAPCSPGQVGAAVTSGSSLPATSPYVATMTFDVASVRENKKLDMSASYVMGAQFVRHTTTYLATNWPIENLISDAYGVMSYQIVGAPNWPWPTFFTIEAKSDSEADAKLATLTREQERAEQQHMLQALLKDRFKLKTHWETREGDVYNMVVAKGGQKLGAEGSMPLSAEDKKQFGDHPVPPLSQKCAGQGCDFIAHGCSMDQLVGILTAQFGRPVTDKTGLEGKYDFELKYKGHWDRERNADDMDPTPPMDRALQEELGLKVEAAKGPVRVLVIDHVEKPSDN